MKIHKNKIKYEKYKCDKKFQRIAKLEKPLQNWGKQIRGLGLKLRIKVQNIYPNLLTTLRHSLADSLSQKFWWSFTPRCLFNPATDAKSTIFDEFCQICINSKFPNNVQKHNNSIFSLHIKILQWRRLHCNQHIFFMVPATTVQITESRREIWFS